MMMSGSSMARLCDLRDWSSLRVIMNWLTQVLNEKRSMPSVTFLMQLWIDLSSSGVGLASSISMVSEV